METDTEEDPTDSASPPSPSLPHAPHSGKSLALTQGLWLGGRTPGMSTHRLAHLARSEVQGGSKGLTRRNELLQALRHKASWEAVLLDNAFSPSTVISRWRALTALKPLAPFLSDAQWFTIRETAIGACKILSERYVRQLPPPSPSPLILLLLLDKMVPNLVPTDKDWVMAALLALASSTGCHKAEACRLLPSDLVTLAPPLQGMWITWRRHKGDRLGTEVRRDVITAHSAVQLLTVWRDRGSDHGNLPLFPLRSASSMPQFVARNLKRFQLEDELPPGGRFTWRGKYRHAVLTFTGQNLGREHAQRRAHHRSSLVTDRYIDQPLTDDMTLAQIFQQ